eukprot:TRINITY_DN87001_c0_g1_i1.p1 TRINITY_DN87001_c0_g1~~TRINITY_DN87001_c0_g1_i1.p1  ORF type:complete len:289 (-),score=62.11 TRINITY_DN87001_c0_g1_i1:288-1154(-)
MMPWRVVTLMVAVAFALIASPATFTALPSLPPMLCRVSSHAGALAMPQLQKPRSAASSGSSRLAPMLLAAFAAGFSRWQARRPTAQTAPRSRAARHAWPWEDDDPYSKCTAMKLQIGMQFSKSVLASLNKLADTADTSTDEGLHQLLLDVVLALKRSESTWRYASVERLISDAEDEGRAAGAALQRWGLEGQSKWGDGDQWEKMDKTPKGVTEYLVVTMALSCYGTLCKDDENLKVRNMTDVKKIIDAVSGVQVDELMQLDVQWIPEEEGDSLSAMEVTMKFPELVMI